MGGGVDDGNYTRLRGFARLSKRVRLRDAHLRVVQELAEDRTIRSEYRKVRGGLVKMMASPAKWCGPSTLREPDISYDVDHDLS
jgi:hypothetical protein